MSFKNISVLLLICCCSSAWSYKILMVCGPPTRSHYNLCSAITDILTERNHQVTFVTPYSANKPTKYREILIDMKDLSFPSAFTMSNMSGGDLFAMMTELTPSITNAIMEDEKFKKIMNDKSEKFDLVIIDYVMNHNLLGLSVKFDCPAILMTSTSIVPWLISATGNPFSLATVPSLMSTFPVEMNLWQRVVNTFQHIFMETINCIFFDPIVKKLYEKDFPEESKRVPYAELRHKVAAGFSNSHHSIGVARPFLPNVLEIAGFHIENPAPLPDDLKKIMDTAKDGVIFFSLGSVVKTKEMSPEFRQAVIKSLSKFKQTVLWKFDDEIIDLPKNIITRKWLPQTSILAHPNIKLFITHGGLLSCTEATHFGVPILLIPVFGDQLQNAKLFSDRGQGLALKFNEINEESFTNSVEEIINNPKYEKDSRRLSQIFHDRSVKPRDLVAYQVEHVIKTGGGSHLSAPYLPKYSLLLLDVFALLSLPTLAILLLLYCGCKKMCRKIFKSDKKIKKN